MDPVAALTLNHRPLVVLLLSMAIDLACGDPPNRWHPVAGMGWVIRQIARRAHRFGPRAQRRIGLGLVLAGGVAFGGAAFLLGEIAEPLGWPGIVVQAVLLKAVFSFRLLLETGGQVQRALEQDDEGLARDLLARHLVSRDTRSLQRGQLASAAIESLSENLTDSLIAPWLAFALGGLPLAWAYRFVNTADAMIGYLDPIHRHLGRAAARLDDLLNWIPARLAALLLAVAAPAVGGSTRRAWSTAWSQHRATLSPNAGWTMAAAAGALDVTLEKPGAYRLGSDRRLPASADVARARWHVAAAAIMGLLGIGVLVTLLEPLHGA